MKRATEDVNMSELRNTYTYPERELGLGTTTRKTCVQLLSTSDTGVIRKCRR